MSTQYLNAYKNATAGTVDGELISNGDLSNALEFRLTANTDETKTTAIGLRCISGYESFDTTVSIVGDNADRFLISKDGTTFVSEINITDIIGDKNTIVYVKAMSIETDEPLRDTTNKISIAYKVQVKA